MSSLWNDIKMSFMRKDNALAKLIAINVGVFVLAHLIIVPSRIAGFTVGEIEVMKFLHLSPRPEEFIFRPWTLFTTFFAHLDVFHILFNMLFLYYFGSIISEYLGGRRLISLYILGGISGSLLFLLFYNTIPYFMAKSATTLGLIGASAAIYAVVVGAATLLPDYSFHLIFLGPVRLKYIAAFYVFLSFIGITGGNAGGNIAHLGGAIMGFVFIKQLRAGNDWGRPISGFFAWVDELVTPGPAMKVSHRNLKNKQSSNPDLDDYVPDEKEIDAILDKISSSGVDSLTREERQKLYKASKQDK